MRHFYCKSRHGYFIYPLSRVIKQQKRGVDTEIICEVPSYEHFSQMVKKVVDNPEETSGKCFDASDKEYKPLQWWERTDTGNPYVCIVKEEWERLCNKYYGLLQELHNLKRKLARAEECMKEFCKDCTFPQQNACDKECCGWKAKQFLENYKTLKLVERVADDSKTINDMSK